MSSNSEVRDFIDASREFLLMSSSLNALDWRIDPPGLAAQSHGVADPHNRRRVNRGELKVNYYNSHGMQ